MKQENAYKIKLLKLLEILRQDSDEDHYIGTTELIDKLADMGIVCDRRTLYKDIEVLNNFGYEVFCEKSPGKPNCYCVADRSFDVPELRILMDAVQAASFVTPSKTEVLLDKIADLGGSHRAELLQSNIVRFNTTKSTNENIFYAISEINSAIENNKKVSFEYFDFNEKHERVYRKDHKRYFVNPLAIEVDTLRQMITKKTGLVSVMMVNNEIGTIQPIKELCQVAHNNGALFHTDAVQAVGHLEVDVKALGVDMLSASAHKFNGPKGVGFLYIKKGTSISPLINGGSQESGHRAGTENVAYIAGMAVALDENIEKLNENQLKIKELRKRLISQLRVLSFSINGSENGIDNILSLSFPNQSGEAMLHKLDLLGVMISTGSACDSKETQVSHVIKAIHLPDDLAEGTIRISLSSDNTLDEMDTIAEKIKRCCNL